MRYFGSSGIRGVYGEKITPDLALNLGKAIGSTKKSVAVAKDTRVSGKVLKLALISGLISSGCEVTNFSIAPTPVLSFGTREQKKGAGIMITASHNPAQYNGFKICNSEGMAYSRKEEEEIENLLDSKNYKVANFKEIQKDYETYDVSVDYAEKILESIKLKGNKKVLIDAANGAAYGISPLLLEEYKYNVVSINEEADGLFPNRDPEPIEKNLKEASRTCVREKCDIGFCHDGDADRVIPIDEKGHVVDFDKFLAYLCRKMIEETKNKKVVTTVDASMAFEEYLADSKVIRTQVGDVFVANKLKETGACFGGEPCGAFIFPEFGLWPDGIYSMIKTLSFLEQEKKKLSELLKEIPKYPVKRIKVHCNDEKKQKVMKELKSKIPKDCTVMDIDGLRMKFNDHLVLIRPSGTEPFIRINVEALTEKKIQQEMKKWEKIIKELIKEKI